MIGTGQDPTLLISTNIVLGVACALFWLWILAVISCELYRRWRTRASLPQGWPPEDKPVVPDAWPPAANAKRAEHLKG
jgi:hypothetical protein